MNVTLSEKTTLAFQLLIASFQEREADRKAAYDKAKERAASGEVGCGCGCGCPGEFVAEPVPTMDDLVSEAIEAGSFLLLREWFATVPGHQLAAAPSGAYGLGSVLAGFLRKY